MATVHELDTSGYAALAIALKREGTNGITARIRAAIDALGMVETDESDGTRAVTIFQAPNGDELFELVHVDMGFGAHSFDLRRYKLIDTLELNYGGLQLQG